ncbi:MAG: NAD(+) synthase [Clostridiales bacterium]|nr:NAD(+) synthase [Clostridiales bacterium]
MKDGFIKVAALSPEIRVADCVYNTESICAGIEEGLREHAKILVFPELCVTGYTCGDLFWQETLLEAARDSLSKLIAFSAGKDALIFVGLPLERNGKLYNAAAAFSNGELLGFVPKRHLPNYNEFYEARYFTPGCEEVSFINFNGQSVPFGMNLLFYSDEGTVFDGVVTERRPGVQRKCGIGSESLMGRLCVAAELCEDLWAPNPPSTAHALAGANVIVNLSASDEVIGKSDYRRNLVAGQSARLLCGYIYASAGEGESTQDVVYGGHCLLAENGHILAESLPMQNRPADDGAVCVHTRKASTDNAETPPMTISGSFRTECVRKSANSLTESCTVACDESRNQAETLPARCKITYTEFDISRLCAERRRNTTFQASPDWEKYLHIPFHLNMEETVLTRVFDRAPFVPDEDEERSRRCEEILTIQALGLKKRIQHTKAKSLVVGISGGLDSTLALLVMTRACDLLGLPRDTMIAVTMPGFGTTDRTYNNACSLAKGLGAKLLEVDIRDAVNIHFRDIGQNPEVHDVTYENGQARERTQILMDLANKTGGLVIGTGDMSELALGWATYNGDHMSMYGVNCSVPKTLVRHLVRYYADTCRDLAVSGILYDVLDTPVSPELLPPKDGKISQKTEDLVGPYELHDFFLYYLLRFGYPPAKIYRIAKQTFQGVYDEETILKWLKTFYRRFFAQQFKRSCIPDGPKVGSVALSPRGDLRMPSDASVRIWMDELERL